MRKLFERLSVILPVINMNNEAPQYIMTATQFQLCLGSATGYSRWHVTVCVMTFVQHIDDYTGLILPMISNAH